jgi:hypothetical protein
VDRFACWNRVGIGLNRIVVVQLRNYSRSVAS